MKISLPGTELNMSPVYAAIGLTGTAIHVKTVNGLYLLNRSQFSAGSVGHMRRVAGIFSALCPYLATRRR
ncbi:hypothetical protein K9M06_00465 [Candidatus Bipolaricaulota bacterium]|nr:hypothetical protein [Candidatus Bipolaricaulota bacterium]